MLTQINTDIKNPSFKEKQKDKIKNLKEEHVIEPLLLYREDEKNVCYGDDVKWEKKKQ